MLGRRCASEDDGLTRRLGGEAMARVFKLSRGGALAGGSFLLSAAGVFAWIVLVASRNPADSGESGILLLPFTMPWIMLIPAAWLGPWVGLGCILLNSLVLYCVFGGLRISRPATPPS